MNKNLEEQIKEFKSPQNKVLVTALFLAVIAMWAKIWYSEKKATDKCEKDLARYEKIIERKDSIINSINISEALKSYEERKEFKVLIAQQDSTINQLQKTLRELKK